MPLTDLGNADDPKSLGKKKKNWITDESLYRTASKFYYYMQADAELVDGQLVWEGSMSHWFIERGLRHLYSPVTRLLYAAGCCNLASRGGGTRPSLVHLHHAPTLTEVKSLRENQFFFEKDALTGKAKEKVLEQMVNNHRQQIADLTDRIERLEKKVD